MYIWRYLYSKINNILKHKNIINTFLFILSIGYLGWYIPISLGYEFHFFDPSTEGRTFRYQTILVFLTLLLYTRIRILGWINAFIITLAIFYSLIGIQYGPPSIGIIQSIINTNSEEALEMGSSVPFKLFLYLALAMCSLYIYIKNIKKTKSHYMLLVAGILLLPLGCLKGMFLKRFIQSTVYTITNYQKETTQLKLSATMKPNWGIKNKKENKKNYVIIIGESARADYSSLYGYTLPTTPFIKNNSNIIFKNATSPASNTILSVPRILTVNIDQYRIKNAYDAVTLAKAAGLETWWLSAQGKSGYFDTEITYIASRSDHINYLQLGDHTSRKVDDYELLNHLKDAISSSKKPKAMFLHLLGSHHDPCERLGEFPIMDSLPKEWSQQLKCYVTSIRKTDNLIKEVNTIMQGTNQPYEIIYFSDHGVYITNKTMLHSQTTREAYHIPFIVIDSEKNNSVTIEEPFDMRNFIDFFAAQLNIETQQTVDDWKKTTQKETIITPISWDKEHLINLNSLGSNPAISP